MIYRLYLLVVLKHAIALFVKENGLGVTLTGPSLQDISVMDGGGAKLAPPPWFLDTCAI